MSLAEAIAAIFAKALVQEVLERFPEIISAYQRATTVHMTDAQNAPPDLLAQLNQRIADATK
jgi:hypothetical protein